MEKILVIEDDQNVRSNTIEILREEGYNVIEAENGKSGLDMAKRFLPDLIISDILMPELDGYGVLEQLQKDVVTSSIPFIFLSARSSSSDIRYGMQKGADDYLSKPYKMKDLLDVVNTRLSKRRHVDSKLEELYEHISKHLPHELRTPLVSILGFSDFIQNYSEALTNNEIIEMVRKINTAGNRLFRLIQKFLEYTEISIILSDREQLQQVRNMHIKSAQNSITTCAAKTAEEFGRGKDIKLKLVDSDIHISEYYLQILLKEIIENSSKFSKTGTSIEITSSVMNNNYIIEIKDYGIGMSLQQIKSIGLMKQFSREDFNHPGIGIGLILSKKITELHNGSFDIESLSESYTKVIITLPVFNSNN